MQGKILERLVDTGQTVKQGQPLMRLDPVDLKLQAQAQQRAVDAAQARARKASSDEARYRGLVASGAVSASEYDQIKAAADSARAELSAARAQAGVAQNATGYAVLLADSDGVVMETLAEPGQVVSAGQAVIRLAVQGSARRWSSCRKPCALPWEVQPWQRSTVTKSSPLARSCACCLIQPMRPPVPLRPDTCWMARWRTRRWGRP